MTDERFAFIEDVKERSMIKKSAHYRKNGSSTQKSFKHDLTDKEIEARHGPCKVYNLGQFISFEEFKGMPKDIQIRYINMLQDKYDVGILTINREVFDIREDDNRLKNYLRTQGILKETYPGTKRKKTGLDQLRIDILNQKKGINMPEELIHDVPKFMSYEEFKKLTKEDQAIFVNRLLKEYNIGVGTIETYLFNKPNSRAFGVYCKRNALNIEYVLPSKAYPKTDDVKRFKAAVAEWCTSNAEVNPEVSVENNAVVDKNTVATADTSNDIVDSTIHAVYIPEEPILQKPIVTETKTMAFETEYIANEIDFDTLYQIKLLFHNKKIRVHVSVEAV